MALTLACFGRFWENAAHSRVFCLFWLNPASLSRVLAVFGRMSLTLACFGSFGWSWADSRVFWLFLGECCSLSRVLVVFGKMLLTLACFGCFGWNWPHSRVFWLFSVFSTMCWDLATMCWDLETMCWNLLTMSLSGKASRPTDRNLKIPYLSLNWCKGAIGRVVAVETLLKISGGMKVRWSCETSVLASSCICGGSWATQQTMDPIFLRGLELRAIRLRHFLKNASRDACNERLKLMLQ